jgi:hypothetical protein
VNIGPGMNYIKIPYSEYGNESSGFVKERRFLTITNHRPIKKVPANINLSLYLTKYYALKTYGECGYKSMCSYPRS